MTSSGSLRSTTDSKILAIVEGVESSAHVLEAAIERAEQNGASLVVLHVIPYHIYDQSQQSVARSHDLTYDGHTFTLTQARESARDVAERAVEAVIGDHQVPFTAVGRVGGLVATILVVAAEQDCDTIMLPEIDSWWHRTIGRVDRRIAEQFKGTVIRVPHHPPENLKTVRPLPQA